MARQRPRSSPAATALVAAVAVPALGLAGCSAVQPLPDSRGVAGTVVVDGASSLVPLAEEARDEFVAEVEPGVVVEVSTSSTARGLEKFCAGETDVALATRTMSEDEAAACEAAGVGHVEVPVAVDAVSVVVPRENDFLRCLTTDELAELWAPQAEGTLTSWSQLRDGFPDRPVRLFGPADGSGTFDYFTDVVGESDEARSDYAASDDEDVIVEGVRDNPGALGIVGLTHVADADGLRTVAIDSGEGCVAPGPDTAADGSYSPLSRTLLVYASAPRYEADPAVAAFVDYLVDRSAVLARRSNAVPLGDGQEAAARNALTSLAGSG